MICTHLELSLREWYFTIYVFLRSNTSIRQIEAGLDLSYRTVRRCVERPGEALEVPSITVEIHEIYVSADFKAYERD